MPSPTFKPNKPLSITSLLSLFGQFQGPSWFAWTSFLKATFGLPLTQSELATFQRCTNRKSPPDSQVKEAWVIVGRRGGKSIISALCAVYLALFRDYSTVLAPGEKGTLMVLAADRRQARTVFRYVTGLLESVPALSEQVASKTAEAIELTNRINVEIHTSSFRSTRGYTIVGCIADEIAFWRSDESANPDSEIINSIRPGMASVSGSLLLCIGSPYAKRGELWKAYKEHYGKDGDTLVWQADTQTMNPSIDKAVIERAYQEDEASAASEYGAQFRTDLESFVSQEIIESAMVPGRYALPYVPGETYHGFVDPSGGSQDSMTLAISHNHEGAAVLDCIIERVPPFSPDAVVIEFCDMLKAYGLTSVQGDRYGGEWPRERFRERGIEYQVCSKTKSEIYLSALPMLNSGKVELLDSRRLKAQLGNLERRTSRGGKDSIDHGPGSHDDVSNAACGAIVMAGEGNVVDVSQIVLVGSRLINGNPDDSPFSRGFRNL